MGDLATGRLGDDPASVDHPFDPLMALAYRQHGKARLKHLDRGIEQGVGRPRGHTVAQLLLRWRGLLDAAIMSELQHCCMFVLADLALSPGDLDQGSKE